VGACEGESEVESSEQRGNGAGLIPSHLPHCAVAANGRSHERSVAAAMTHRREQVEEMTVDRLGRLGLRPGDQLSGFCPIFSFLF
jgi:hypothetical protein